MYAAVVMFPTENKIQSIDVISCIAIKQPNKHRDGQTYIQTKKQEIDQKSVIPFVLSLLFCMAS